MMISFSLLCSFQCSFYTPPSLLPHINFSSLFLVIFVFPHCSCWLQLIFPPPLLPPPSLDFSTSISSDLCLFWVFFIRLVYCTGTLSEIPKGEEPVEHRFFSLLSPQQLADIWLITSCNVYCGRASL